MSKNKNQCINNIKGYCYLGKSQYFSKPCNKNCSSKVYYNSSNMNKNFDIYFLKTKGKLELKIKIPIDYKNFRKVIKGKVWTFQCIQKEKNVLVQILLYDLESYIHFLFNDFDSNIYVKSSYLYIILNDVEEITNNKIPYNQMKNKIKIKRNISNNLGQLYLTININKELVFSSVYKLFRYNKTVESNTKNNVFKNTEKTLHNSTIKSQNSKKEINQKQTVCVKAIVLHNNRKCLIEKHNVIDINAVIKIVQPTGKVVKSFVPAAYCEKCNQYIILKNDFKSLKERGVLLCKVTDKTPEYITKHKQSSYNGTESRVHSLGYNVIKQRYNYTFEQRKIILANIIENYGITQHEILSMLDTNISRKINLPNYAEAVNKWQQDREFVLNHKSGDCPQVVVDEVIIGTR